MQPTVYQKPEIRDANDNIIQQGAFGKNTALANATNDGWIDYVANDLEFLYDLAKDEVVPVPSLPASGQTNKTYLLTTTGVSYRWSGTQWVAVSSSEAVGRAESAANLAEQWATKTDGTVDGTEYSAKYYAEQAEASADDAQDVADDMATHLVQIDKNTGGVSKNSKRISNIEKLLQGNLYDYDTDDDSAYTKTVPSGALPYAGIEQIGGKTIVYNQILPNTSSRTEWEAYTNANLTLSFNDNVLNATINISSSGGYTVGIRTGRASYPGYRTIAGHKYYISYTVKSDMACSFGDEITGEAKTALTISNVDTWYKYEAIRTPQSYEAGWKTSLMRPVGIEGANLQGMTYSVKEPILIDLTLMFGSGNEPTTVAEFEAMFPASYYPYNAGTLLSAGVTEVKSVGKNIFDERVLSNAGITKDANGFYSATVSTWISAFSTLLPVAVPYKSGQYTVSCKYYFSNIGTFTGNAVSVKAEYSDSSNNNIFNLDARRSTPTDVSNATLTSKNVNYLHMALLDYRTNNYILHIKDIQVEEGTTATAYNSVFDTYSIPAEVRALEGYGWGIVKIPTQNEVYNEIDFERKVFIQRVAKVTITSADVPSADSGSIGSTTFGSTWGAYAGTWLNIRNFKQIYQPIVSGGYAGQTHKFPVNIDNSGIMASQYRTVFLGVPDRDTLISLIGDGLDMYYELATPIETDISAYLSDDDLIEVGAGGTLTFPNQNGDDYHIPVPSDVTYMIDLQEAVSNG